MEASWHQNGIRNRSYLDKGDFKKTALSLQREIDLWGSDGPGRELFFTRQEGQVAAVPLSTTILDSPLPPVGYRVRAGHDQGLPPPVHVFVVVLFSRACFSR